jgi:metal-dependent HD superfamily phosphatase/phosphodiesterase
MPDVPLREAIAVMNIHAPSQRNRKLAGFLAAANADTQLKARWHAAQMNAERLEMSDHSWVHLQIVLNRALRLFRLLRQAEVQSAIERAYGLNPRDAEVVIAAGCLLHDLGMSIHRVDHEAYSLFLAADVLDRLLDGIYEEPDRTVIASDVMHAIIGHRSAGRPLTLEAGIVRVADALDMEQGRSRIPFERGRVSIHSLSAAAIEDVMIEDGDERPVKIEIVMNNSSGLYQVDGLLKAKLRGSGLEPYVEVIAHIDTEAEKRLVPVYKLET